VVIVNPVVIRLCGVAGDEDQWQEKADHVDALSIPVSPKSAAHTRKVLMVPM
jgi:hypothetical protein